MISTDLSTLLEEQLRKNASALVDAATEKTTLFKNQSPMEIARFDIEECVEGPELGRGAFSVVREVSEVFLTDSEKTAVEDEECCYKPSSATGRPSLRGVGDSYDSTRVIVELRDRKFIASTVKRNGIARYAIKKLSTATKQKGSSKNEDERITFTGGVLDLAMEMKFLKFLQHPHIIKMRGFSNAPVCSEDFFIMLDRLYQTLGERIETWRKQNKSLSSLLSSSKKRKRKKQELLNTKLCVSHDIASALGFLHSHDIVYRDLKPENMGFDARGDVKLFDFGLAREMTVDVRTETVANEVLYNMTPGTGSPRYMSPEVALNMPYNQKTDIYSYGLIVWGIFQLDVPFKNYEMKEDFFTQVLVEGDRPRIDKKSWPTSISDTIVQCWSETISSRPEFSDVLQILRKEIAGISSSQISELDISNRTLDSFVAKQ